jgi:hypothetical protein
MILDLSRRPAQPAQPETPEQTIARLQIRVAELVDQVEALERRLSDQSWQLSPDRQGGHTPPNEIRGSWDQWGH